MVQILHSVQLLLLQKLEVFPLNSLIRPSEIRFGKKSLWTQPELLYPNSDVNPLSSPDDIDLICPDSLEVNIPSERAAKKERIQSLLLSLRNHWKTKYSKYAKSSLEIHKNPLIFWRDHHYGQTLAELHPYVRAILATPSNSSLSESIFSLSGALKSKSRSCLKPEFLNQMTFVKFNMNTVFPCKESLVEAAFEQIISIQHHTSTSQPSSSTGLEFDSASTHSTSM